VSYLKKEKRLIRFITASGLILFLGTCGAAEVQSTDPTQVVTDQSVTNDVAHEDKVVPATPSHKKHHHEVAPLPATATPEVTEANITPRTHANSLTASPVVERAVREEKLLQNSFSIAFYKPTYILPFYYTASPDNAVYVGETPQDESLKKSEVKYQLSFKVPIWQRIFNLPSTLFFAYTQLSYWQLYDRDPFFRETDYEPEAFLANEVNWHLFGKWHLNFINLGAVHQSNGYGGSLERSWNRIYLSATASSDNWVITVRPWYVFHDDTYERQNPTMANYLGHEQFIVAYKYYNQVITLEARNVIEHHANKAAVTASWSFPLTKHLNGYVQVFSGYGQSLIEYNHRTNSVGLGIALSNWV
jgi:phospholipase A1